MQKEEKAEGQWRKRERMTAEEKRTVDGIYIMDFYIHGIGRIQTVGLQKSKRVAFATDGQPWQEMRKNGSGSVFVVALRRWQKAGGNGNGKFFYGLRLNPRRGFPYSRYRQNSHS